MNSEFYNSYFKLEKENWWFKVRRSLIFSLFDQYKIRPHSKVLDFGCGSGFLVGRLAERGYEAHGLDASPEAIDFGRSKNVPNLELIKTQDFPYPDNYFDAVLALDVLEHLENDSKAVQELGRVLKPGGKAIIMVPAFMFLWGVQDDVAHHYRRYNKPELLRLIDQTKFKVIRATYFNFLLFFPIAAVRIVSKLFNIKGRESDFDINNKFLNRLFFEIFDFERRLLKNTSFPFGVSILTVFQKNA